MNREIWRLIPEWPEYAASSHGRIKRVIPEQRAVTGRILKPCLGKNGYKYVSLTHNNIPHTKTVHRLIALTFLGTPPTIKHQCNHINGKKTDNRRENLEWVTHRENAIHSYKLGLTKKPPTQYGESVYGCKITRAVAQAILDAPLGYGTGKLLAERFHVTEAIVSFIRRRRTWKYLTNPQVPQTHQPKFHHTPKHIVELILKASTGYGTGRKLATQFGLSEGTISKIRHQARQVEPPGLFLHQPR